MMRRLFLTICLLSSSLAFAQEKVEVLFPCSSSLESPHGIQAEIAQKSGEFLTKDTAFDKAQQAGANCLRVPIPWSVCWYEGNFISKMFDEAMEAARLTPFSLTGVLSPSYDNKLSVWNHPNDYIRYVKEVASRYKFYISDWEVIPGLDYLKYQGAKLTPMQVYRAVRGTCAMLKSINPDNRVVLGALDNPRGLMLDSLCFNGGTKFFDVLSFTCYGDPEHIIAQARGAKVLMKKYNWSKPVWITNAWYGSMEVENTDNDFWEDLLPLALGKLKTSPGKVTVGVVVSDQERLSALNDYQIERFFEGKFKAVRRVPVTGLAGLDPAEVQVLVPGRSVAYSDIKAYLEKGGTIVLTDALWPSVTHIGIKHTNNNPARYLTSERLAPGEEMIPLQKTEIGVLAAVYKLSAGNIIVHSRRGFNQYVDTEKEQAKRIARIYLTAYACGIDRVYWNGLRSKEKDRSFKSQFAGLYHSDYSPKPAAQAFQTLTKFLPSGSSRPELRIKDGVYLANWTATDGTAMGAVWCPGRHAAFDIKVKGRVTFFDYLGNKLKSVDEINDGVCFIQGAQSIEF